MRLTPNFMRLVNPPRGRGGSASKASRGGIGRGHPTPAPPRYRGGVLRGLTSRPLRGGGVGFLEVGLAEAVEAGATFEDVGRDLARHVLQQIFRHVREVRVEVR